jgi:hypothetical protein
LKINWVSQFIGTKNTRENRDFYVTLNLIIISYNYILRKDLSKYLETYNVGGISATFVFLVGLGQLSSFH